MKIVMLTLAIFYFYDLELKAQRTNFESGWHPGVIILSNNSILKGDLNYVQKNEWLKLRMDDSTATFHARQVKYFQFYEAEKGYNRAFKPLPTGDKNLTPDWAFFEIVLEGRFPFFRKPILVEKIISQSEQASSEFKQGDFVEYIYFLKVDDKLIEIKNFGDDALPHLKKHISDINAFIKDNKLNINLTAGQIQIIDYYNLLEENKNPRPE